MLEQKLYAYNRTLLSGDKANPISTQSKCSSVFPHCHLLLELLQCLFLCTSLLRRRMRDSACTISYILLKYIVTQVVHFLTNGDLVKRTAVSYTNSVLCGVTFPNDSKETKKKSLTTLSETLYIR